MSIANLEIPNNFDLFCDSLTANTLNIGSLTVNTLNSTNINNSNNINTLSLNLTGGPIISNVNGSNTSALVITNTHSPLTSTMVFLDNTIDTTSSTLPILGIKSGQVNQQLQLWNTNASSTSNGIVFQNSSGAVVLQVGTNNSTSTDYILSSNGYNLNLHAGTGNTLSFGANGGSQYTVNTDASITASVPLNLTFSNCYIKSWSASIVTPASFTAFTVTIPPNVNYTINTTVLARVTTGANIGDGRFTQVVGTFRNVAGAITQVGSTAVIYNTTDTSLNAVTFNYSSAFGSTIFVIASALVGYTIQFGGTYTVFID